VRILIQRKGHRRATALDFYKGGGVWVFILILSKVKLNSIIYTGTIPLS
jgi:hypothetical protein